MAIAGDLKTRAARLAAARASRAHHDAWITRIGELAGGPTVRDIEELPDDGRLCAAHVIHDIWKATDGRAIIVTDVGQHQMWTAQYYKVAEPGTFITSGGLGTMGFGVPAAIGAKMARPDREVWAIVGDGGFQMTQAELQTMVQENVKVNVAIINNGYLGMVRQWQQFFHDRRYSATPMSSPDYVKLADAHGLPGVRVTRRADMADALRHARASAGAVVMDFRVEQEDTVYPMVSPGAALHDMIKRPGARVARRDGSRPAVIDAGSRRAPSSSATSTRSTRSIASPASCGGSACAPRRSPPWRRTIARPCRRRSCSTVPTRPPRASCRCSSGRSACWRSRIGLQQAKEQIRDSDHGEDDSRRRRRPLTRSCRGKVAIMGYGSQGHAHALNLKDSGADVRVGVRPGSRGWKAAEQDGFAPLDPAAAAAWADVIMILVPDLVQPDLFKKQIAPHLTPGKMLMFAHGFAIRFGWITPPAGRRRVDGGAEGAGPSRP